MIVGYTSLLFTFTFRRSFIESCDIIIAAYVVVPYNLKGKVKMRVAKVRVAILQLKCELNMRVPR